MGGVNGGICIGCECLLRQDVIFASEPRAVRARAEHAAVMCLTKNTKREWGAGGRNHSTQSEMFDRLWPNLGNF